MDTNVLSAGAPVRAVAMPALTDWMDRNSASLFLSVITIAEVEDGIAKSRRLGARRKAEQLSAKSDASRMLSARTAREFGYVFFESQRRKLKSLYGREIREDRGAEVLRRHAELDRQDHGLDAV